MLLLVLLTINLLWAGRCEELPPETMEQFVGDLLLEAKGLLDGRTPLEELHLHTKSSFFGIPIRLDLDTENVTLVGPTDLRRSSYVTGYQNSGTAWIRTVLSLGDFKVLYQRIELGLYGRQLYSGSGRIALLRPSAELQVQVYRNVLTACQVSVEVSRPTGTLVVVPGREGGLLAFLATAAEYFLAGFLPSNWLRDWDLFPVDVTEQLQLALQISAKKIACNYWPL